MATMGLLAVAGRKAAAAGTHTVPGSMFTLFGKTLRCYSTLSEQEQEDHGKKMEELRKLYAGNRYSYHNYPVSKVTVEVGRSAMGMSNPMLLFDGQRGLVHLTPFACAYFAYLGPDGDRGQVTREDRESGKNDQLKAHQEVALSSYHLHSMEKENKELLEYFGWVKEVEGVVVRHVKDNIKRYPILDRAFVEQSTMKDGLSVEDSVPHRLLPSVRLQAHKGGQEGPTYSVLKARNKIYVPARGPPDHFAYMIDRDMYTKQRVVRQELGLFRVDGSSIPLTEQHPMVRGDVVSAMVELNSYLASFGFGLTRKLKSVTVGWENEVKRKEVKGTPTE